MLVRGSTSIEVSVSIFQIWWHSAQYPACCKGSKLDNRRVTGILLPCLPLVDVIINVAPNMSFTA